MIPAAALQGLAFPWLLMGTHDRVLAAGSGSLFPCPDYTTDTVLGAALTVSIGGWGLCPNGYAIHRFTSPVLERNSIVLHGLKVHGQSTAKGRSETLSIKLGQHDVLNYVNDFCIGLEALDDHYGSLIRQNIHEIRGINSELYNTAFGLHSAVESGNASQQQQWTSTAKSVVSWSEILRGRIDFMEFIANPNTQQVSKNDIFPYRKFDRLQRSFRVTATQRNITLDISGGSTKAVYGPPIFDLIPFLLIENAIKYAPNGTAIRITVSDGDRSIYCSVTSTGPRIMEEELSSIFNPGFRGKNAIKTQSGSGLGLSVLQRVVKTVFNGSVGVSQEAIDKRTINGTPYCEITFELRLPMK